MICTRYSRRGMMLADLVVSIAIATLLMVSIASAIGRLHRSEQQLSDARAHMRRLDATLLALQNDLPADPAVRVTPLRDAAPQGRLWVRLELKDAGPGPVQLTGLVPAGAAKGGTP